MRLDAIKSKIKQGLLPNRSQVASDGLSSAYCFSINLILTFSLVLLIIIPLILILYKAYHLNVPPVDLEELYSQFLAFGRPLIHPKRDEHFVFITTVLCLPVIVYLAAQCSVYLTKRFSYNHYFQYYTKGIVCLLSLMMILFTFSSDYFANLRLPFFNNHPKLTIVILLGLILFTWYLMLQHFTAGKERNSSTSKIWSALVILVISLSIILISAAFRISNLNIVSDSPAWVVNFGAVFYNVTQVYAGKSLLVNLPSQYGMYSELLNPIFQLIGLSVFKFTLVMELLQMTALFAIFTILWKLIDNKLLVLISMLTLCYITGFTWLFLQGGGGYAEPYFQYFPIRFFFPAVSLVFFLSLIKDKKQSTLLLLSAISAIAIIWNIESGIAVFGTLMAYLCSLILFPTAVITRKNALKLVLFSSIIFFVCSSIFFAYLRIKAGHALDLSLIQKYQHIFYVTGFAMLPIPLKLGVWQIMISCYLIGIIGAVLNWIKGERPLHWEMIFCLSIMGLALFAYYEGRSHPNVLVISTWPAIVILYLLCDRALTLIRSNLVPGVFITFCFPVLFFGLFLSAEFIVSTPVLVNSMITRWNKMIFATEETPVIKNLAFIKNHLNGRKEVFILAPNQSVYYAEANLASSIDGPGSVEILLRADLEQLKKKLLANTQPIFYKPDNIGNSLDADLKDTFDAYHVVVKNNEMSVLEPRRAN